MSRAQKTIFATVLFVLAVSFGGGVLIGAAHVAVATFLTVSALFLGFVAGLALLRSAIRIPGSPAGKALFTISGLLLTGALVELLTPPFAGLTHLGIPMFLGGSVLGIAAIGLCATRSSADAPVAAGLAPLRSAGAPQAAPAASLKTQPYAATAGRAVADPARQHAR